jgi:integrase
MRTQLTKRVIANLRSKERPYEVRDTLARGLIVRVQPSGHKAFIVTWAHGKRRTLGSVDHLTLEQARAHTQQAVSEAVQQKLPALAKQGSDCTLETFLKAHYAPWVRTELRGGTRYVQRMETVFKPALGKRLSDLDTAWFAGWWAKRVGGPGAVTRTTAARDIATLRSALSKAVRWKLLDRNPLLDLELRGSQSRSVVRYLSPDEEGKLRAALQLRDQRMLGAQSASSSDEQAANYADHLTPVVLLAINTGMRRGELLSLHWSDVDLARGLLTVRSETAKSGRQRHIPLNAEARAVLGQWRQQCDEAGSIFEPNDVKTAWVKLIRRAGIGSFRFHDLRHHFASRLVMAGVDLNTVRELLGHADLKMTLRYAHLAPEHLAAAVEKLASS